MSFCLSVRVCACACVCACEKQTGGLGRLWGGAEFGGCSCSDCEAKPAGWDLDGWVDGWIDVHGVECDWAGMWLGSASERKSVLLACVLCVSV